MARKERKAIYISLTNQERLRLDRLNELEGRMARAQIMHMVDARLVILDPKFLAANRAGAE